MYALNRLTAPKPEWETAVIYIRGTQPFVVEKKDHGNIRWLKAEDILIIKATKMDDPFNPPRDPYEIGNGRVVPGFPGATCDLEDHIHVEEIVRVSFFSNSQVKVNADLPQTPKILTADGENPDTAKEYAEGKMKLVE
jgi:hypothetical protein